MIINLNEKESKILFENINSESHCIVNEYDPDTRRCPNKKRMSGAELLNSVINKWDKTQSHILGTTFVNLDKITACEIDLSDKETKYIQGLLERNLKELKKTLAQYSQPYTGVLGALDEAKEVTEGIINRLKAA